MGFDGIEKIILQGLLALQGAALAGGISATAFKWIFRITDPYAPLFLGMIPAFWTGRYIWHYPFSWSI